MSQPTTRPGRQEGAVIRILVTGGAGFIGSHIASDWLDRGHDVVVFDDLSTGVRENVPGGAQLTVGDVSSLEDLTGAVQGVDLVFHEAAARAVQRSVDDPLGTELINGLGTLNVLVASRDAGAKRVVLASSSSVYGGVAPVPTPETAPIHPKSPYAVTKLAAEHHARVMSELFEIETVSLRYFNVFGPRQRPDSAYAAVIPLFIDALASGERPTVHGDGRQSRDFTYISDVVRANRLAAEAPGEEVSGNVYNIARGEPSDLLEVLGHLQRILGTDLEPTFTDPRAGDIRRSCADPSRAERDLGFTCEVGLEEGLRLAVDWYRAST